MTNSICIQCGKEFSIDAKDADFYKKLDIPFPKLCPKDRLQRRLAFRNERQLYKRKCDKTGREMISNLRPDASVPVYYFDEWHKDDWNPPALPNFDFSKGFFEQFLVLSKVAPRCHKASAGNEINSEYMNHAGNCKNCYYIFNSEYDEDCMYLRFSDHCRDCVDSTNIFNSELCYECINVENCYNLRFSDDCKTSRDSWFCRNCRGVRNSIFCYGLDQKEYHVFNEPKPKEEYEKYVKSLKLHTYSGLQKAFKEWEQWSSKFPKTRKILQNCEGSAGDALYNCKNSLDCYNCNRLQDCRYVLNSVDTKDTYDMYAYGEIELGCELITVMTCYNIKFCVYVFKSDNMEYCDTCWNCHYCFGCAGLKGKSYCVFNKQYSKEAFGELRLTIIEHMKKTGEYGEFFPVNFSIFPYEDSMANDYFPKKDKTKKIVEGDYSDPSTIPDDINDVNIDSISKKSYLCGVTGKPFRFQSTELQFYKKMQLPLPRVSFEARYNRRNKFIPFPY